MALFDPCMEFEIFLDQRTSFEVLLKCHSLTLSKKCLRLCPAPSKCFSERINWIISRIPRRILKNMFVQGSYESLAMLEGKIKKVSSIQGLIWYDNSGLNLNKQCGEVIRFHKFFGPVLCFSMWAVKMSCRCEIFYKHPENIMRLPHVDKK